MIGEIKFGVLFRDFTDDEEPTDVSFPNARIFQQLIDQSLTTFMSLHWKNKQGHNSCVFVFDCFLSRQFSNVFSILWDGQNELAQLLHVPILVLKRVFSAIFDSVKNDFH